MEFHPPTRAKVPGRDGYLSPPEPRPLKGPSGGRRPSRSFLMGLSLVVMLYSLAVLVLVAWMGDIGARCVFSPELREPIPAEYRWEGGRPNPGDTLVEVAAIPIVHDGDVVPIANYTNYVKALRFLNRRVGQTVSVSWMDQTTWEVKTARVEVHYHPLKSYIWSVVWFGQEMVIFAVGALVFWKRPRDDSARLFFWLCIVTVGAYMGGYHWTEIVVEPVLIYPFAAFAVFVPVVSLHFYLVFPRENPVLAKHRRAVMAALYGVPTFYLGLLWSAMLWSRWLGRLNDDVRVIFALRLVRNLALGYIALAVVMFCLCIGCMASSLWRARTRAERNQVQWILLASLLSSLLIGYLLRQAWLDPSTLGRDSSAWPMFGVSLLYTVAYALSITRYKLMEVEGFISRGVVYVAAGLVYSGVLLLSGVLIGDQLLSANQTSRGALVAFSAMIAILIVSEVARERFQRLIDRRFYHEKYKFDQAMRKMRLAVGSLVDRETLGRRLLEAAAEVMRLEWGAIYLSEIPGGPMRLTACHGPAPDEKALRADNPLIERLRQVPAVRVPHAMSLAGKSDPATDAMIALGGEAASALESDGDLAGLLVLGPKRSGVPYDDEELAFLGALSSVATLALHSAGIQRTLENLNHDLRGKVDKIAEQQRRILILQDQLIDRGAGAPGARSEPEELPGVFDEIKGSGQAVRHMIEVARKVAASPSAVLIRGESGTGKELLAAAIHASSARGARPFVKVHCAALSQSLLESELFGHVRGAFTGADRDRIGRFEQANGGTLFLDEIGDISLEVQTKLLRVLQEMSFERVGSSQPISVDVRILAATHQDLEALIRTGRFREDLYYRLNVISLRTPSLRERKEDIFELAVHFLSLHAQQVGKTLTHLDDEAVEAMVAYNWPGNIRELENVIERAVVLADGPALTLVDLPSEVRQPHAPSRRRPRLSPVGSVAGRARAASLVAPDPIASENEDDEDDEEFLTYERHRLVEALNDARGNKSKAARLLQMPRSTFCSKLKKHGLI